MLAQRADRREAEQIDNGDLESGGRAEAAMHFHQEQRVAAEIEEIIFDAHFRHAELFAPDRRQRFLERTGRRDRRLTGGAAAVGSRQGAAIQLAIGAERQRGERHDAGRDHVVWQLRLQVRPQVARRERPGHRHHIRDDPLVSRGVLPHDHRALADSGMRSQRRFDLAGFDTEPANLDLRVEPAEKRNGAIGPPPHQIAGAIQPRAGRTERVRHEAFRGEIGPVQVTARKAVSADVQLARHAGCGEPPAPVEDVHLRVANRPADRHGRPFGGEVARNAVAAGECRALRRAVAVDELRARQPIVRAPDVRNRQRLAAGEHLPQRRQRVRRVVDHAIEQRRGQPERGHALVAHDAAERVGRRHRVGEHHAAAAVEQRAPDLERGRVERHRRENQNALGRSELDVVDAEEETEHAAVRHFHTLRHAGRSGRVANVGEVLRTDGDLWIRLGLLREAGCLILEAQDRCRHRRQPWQLRPLGHQYGGSDIREHEREPVRRIPRVERHIRGACLQDGEERHDQRRRPIEAKRHAIVGADAGPPQPVRQLIGPPIELAVGDLVGAPRDRHRVRGPFDLGFEDLLDRLAGIVGRPGIVVSHQ